MAASGLAARSICPRFFTASSHVDFGNARKVNLGGGSGSGIDTSEHFADVQTGGISLQSRAEKYGLLCENRFIIWRSYGSCLELLEVSNHYNLSDNSVCLCLPCPVLPSASLHETGDESIALLFGTEQSMYCISLTHPVKMHSGSPPNKVEVQSVLSRLTTFSVASVTKSHPHTKDLRGVRATCVGVAMGGGRALQCLYAEANPLQMTETSLASQGDFFHQFEIQMSSLIRRFLSGFGMGRGPEDAAATTADLLLHAPPTTPTTGGGGGGSVAVVQVSGDWKLRIWTYKHSQGDQASLRVQVALSDLVEPCHGAIRSARVFDMKEPNAEEAGETAHDGDPRAVTLGVFVQTESKNLLYFYRFSLTADSDRSPAGGPQRLGMSCIDGDLQVEDVLLEASGVWVLCRHPGRGQVLLAADWRRREPLRETVAGSRLASEVCLPSEETVQEVYLSALMAPRRFSKAVLREALSCCRPVRAYQFEPGSTNWFRRSFILAAAEEMKAMTLGQCQEVTIEDYLQIWGMVYSSCYRAQRKREENGRLFALSNCLGAGIAKMESVSFVRESPHRLHDNPAVNTVCDCLVLVLDCISDEVFNLFLNDLANVEDWLFLKDYVQRIVGSHPSIGDRVVSRIDGIDSIAQVLRDLTDSLDVSSDLMKQETQGVSFNDLSKPPSRSAFAGEVASSFSQAQAEASLRVLLALQVFCSALDHVRPRSVDLEFTQTESVLRTRMNALMSGWSIVHWMATTRPILPSSLEADSYTPVLKLFEVFSVQQLPEHVRRLPSYPSLLELCFDSLSLDGSVSALSSCVWSETDGCRVMLCLLMNYQFEHMLSLEAKLKAFGVQCSPGMDFLVGEALILKGFYKEALKRLLSCDGFSNSGLNLSSEAYFSRIVEQLKYLSAHEPAVTALEYAVTCAHRGSPITLVLWSNLFDIRLKLGRYREAYQTLLDHPDPTRRRDCLRLFLGVLTERRQLKMLCELQYPSLEVEVGELLWVQARKADLRLRDEVLYSLLNSFYVSRRNYQKAACAVYERACRIAHEFEGPDALYQQTLQLSVAANNLSNAIPSDQWVLVYQPEQKRKDGLFVKDLAELRKEGCVARNLIRIKDTQSVKLAPVSDYYSQGHLVTQALLKQGDFERAFDVVHQVQLPLKPFFEGLVGQLARGRSYHPLRRYLDQCQRRYRLTVYEAVFRKMLSCNTGHPAWFISEYFERHYPVNLAIEYTSCNLLKESFEVVMKVLSTPGYKDKHFTGVDGALDHLLLRLKAGPDCPDDGVDCAEMIGELCEAYQAFHS